MRKRFAVLGVSALAAGAVVAVPVAAWAAQDNAIHGTASGSYTHEAFIRSKTSAGDVTARMCALPPGGMDVELGNAKEVGDPVFTNQRTLTSVDCSTYHTVATNVVAGTKFVLYKKGVGGSGDYSGFLRY
jgi:hypothetical protein